MSEDLDKTLNELGAGYGDVVLRLKAAREVAPSRRLVPKWRTRSYWRSAVAVAASLILAVMSLLMVLREKKPCDVPVTATTSQAGAYSLAFSAADKTTLDEIMRTQNADGSWQNDYLTRQNAAALREVAFGSVTYRKAVRYLRSRGLNPMSQKEFLAAKTRAQSSFCLN